MDAGIAQQIMERAYELDPDGLEQITQHLGMIEWCTATRDLRFQEVGTGGGCAMLSAFLPDPDGHQVIITDGEAGVPITPDRFWMAVVDAEETEIFSISAGR